MKARFVRTIGSSENFSAVVRVNPYETAHKTVHLISKSCGAYLHYRVPIVTGQNTEQSEKRSAEVIKVGILVDSAALVEPRITR